MTVPVCIYSSCDYIQIGFLGKPRRHSFTSATHAAVSELRVGKTLTFVANIFFEQADEQAMNRAHVARALLPKKFRTRGIHARQLQGTKAQADIAKRWRFFPMHVNCRGTPTSMCLSS
jgi:hypothetical protein